MKKLLQFTSVFLCTLLYCFYITPTNVKANSLDPIAGIIPQDQQIESINARNNYEPEKTARLHTADINSTVRLMTARTSGGINTGNNTNTQREYTITFNANYGTLNGNSIQSTVNQRLTSLPSATRPGYTFRGWYTQSTGGTLISTDTVFTINTNVYAQWDNYDANFRDFYISDITDTSAAITTIIPANTYVRTWGISYGTMSTYMPESRVMNLYSATSALTTTLTGLQPNTTYYYKVYYIADATRIESGVGSFSTTRATEYAITFYPNGGTISGQTSVITANQTLPYLPSAYREGYQFDGWYTGAYDGTLITTNTVFRSNSTVYAHWRDAQNNSSSNSNNTNTNNGTSNNGTNGTTSNGTNTNTNNSNSNNSNTNDDYEEPVSVKKIKLKSVKNTPTRRMKVAWNWYAYGDGYQIAYSTNKYFPSNKTNRIFAGVFTDSKTIAGLKRGKTYYVKVRAYQKVGGKKYYGAWSNVKKIKIKK